MDSKLIGFSVNGAQSGSGGNTQMLTLSDGWLIPSSESLPLVYDAVVSALSQPVSEQVLTVVLDVYKRQMPKEVVKSRFLKITSSHIEYVFDALKNNPSDIRNIRNYLLTTLYNAPLTMDSYWTARVNHDFYGQ